MSFFKGFIPKHISDGFVIRVWQLLGRKVPAKKRLAHLKQNHDVWSNIHMQACNGGFIESQELLSDMVFGNKSASYNSCEVIATYNAIHELKRRSKVKEPAVITDTFCNMLAEFESNGPALGGGFGCSPKLIIKSLEERGRQFGMLAGKKIDETSVERSAVKYPVHIAVVYNDREDISKMIHTVCITHSDNGYIVHNSSVREKRYDTLYECLFALGEGKSRPIMLIGVN